MNKYSLKDFREAKIVGPHLEAILQVINLSIRSLQLFKTYLPVIKIINVMTEQKTLLEIHKVRYDKIVKNRGKAE